MKQLTQTNRAILFRKINSEVPSLTKIFSEIEDEEDKVISEELFKKIEENLVVGSFEEFLKKFCPKIYSKSVAGEIVYSLKKDGIGNWVESPINMSNDFIRLILNIIEGKSGTTNIEFEYQTEFNKLLGVDAATQKIKDAVDTITYLIGEYEKAEDGSPEQKKAENNLKRTYADCVKNYSNPITLLPLYQNMILEAIEDKGGSIDDNSVLEAGALQIEDKWMMKENGIPELIAEDSYGTECIVENDLTEKVDTAENSINEQDNKQYSNMLIEVYDKGVEKGIAISDNTGKQMLSAVFGTNNSLKKIRNELRVMPKEELVESYNTFAKQMDSQYENFAKVAKQLIEDVIGVKMFFEQSTCKKNRMSPKLLVTNSELDDFIGKEKKLEQFFERVNRMDNNYDNAIWFAIIPNMELKEKTEANWLVEDEVEAKGNGQGINSVSSVTKIVKLLGNYKVQTFVGFENNAENTFANIQQKGIHKYKKATESFVENDEVNKYMIPCIPNFTVVPESRSRIKSQGMYHYTAPEAVNDSELLKYQKKGDINLGGFYINAAYVAAGIVCACQSPDYLSEHHLKIVTGKEVPGVRFDLEEHFKDIDVKLGIEVGGYSESVKNEINDKQFGFVFASEGGVKSRVMKARCLKKTEEDEFEPIFVTTTYTYIERFYKNNNVNNITPDSMEEFFDNKKDVFWNKYRDCVNGLLQKSDLLETSVDGNIANIMLKLEGVEKQLEFNIDRS